MSYRRSLELNTGTDYWFVDMGRLDVINGPGSYPFPSLAAATLFAKNHKATAPQRDVVIRFPDGRKWDGKEWTE